MRGRVVRVLALVLTVCVAFACASAEAKVVDRIVALVNGEVITQGDLERLIREHVQALRAYGGLTQEQARREAETEAGARLEDLVASALLEQAAREDEEEDPLLVIDQAMLEESVAAFKSEQGLHDEAEFRRALDEQGYTMNTFRREMLRSLRIRELFRRDIFPRLNVTDDEVIAFYEAHKADLESKQMARDQLREQRFAEERERMINRLREESFVKIVVTY